VVFFPLWISVPFSSVFETIAFAIGLDDVDSVGQAVKQRSGESLAAHHFGPLLKGQVRGYDQAKPFIGPADHFKGQLGSRLGERHIPKFIEKDQVVFFHLGEEALELTLLAHLQQVSDQSRRTPEPDPFALRTGHKTQRAGQMGYTLLDNQLSFG